MTVQPKWIGSPNFTSGRQGSRILYFVIHHMAGYLSGADATFQNRSRNTSAHYGIENNEVHQYVDIKNTAYHAGQWGANIASIGIEHSADSNRQASDATYETSAQLMAQLIKENAAPNDRRPHRAFVATACPGIIDLNRLSNRVNEILAGSGTVKPAPATPVNVRGMATVTVDALNVRSQPNSTSAKAGSMTLTRDQTFEFTEAAQGENVRGVSTWLKSTKGNYVWAGGTDYQTTPAVVPEKSQGGTAKATRPANVRTLPSTKGALVKQPDGNNYLSTGQTFTYTAKVYGQYVTQNGVTSNVWYHSAKGNYVWGGNLKEV